MVKENSSENNGLDPKDFGLPKVDTTPLKKKKSPAPKAAKPTERAEAPIQPDKNVEMEEVAPAVVEPVFPPKEDVQHQAAKDTTESVGESDQKAEAEPARPLPAKKSNTWVYAVIVIGLALVSLIVWQLQEETSSPALQPESTSSTTAQESIAPEDTQVSEEEVLGTEIEPADQEQLASDEVKEIPDTIENTQSGTTIEQESAGELIRIETKPVPSQYFIVVGSLPSERLALEESAKYWDRAETMYLLSPTADSKNYRLAIGQFNRFTAANEELQRVKSEYTEALWILKY